VPLDAHFATLWESFADALGEQPAVSQGAVRRTWREYDHRAARVAAGFRAAGVGPQAKVALYLYNSVEYLEAQFAAFKIRAVPINVNYRYLDDELHYLLENADAEVVVFHASLASQVAKVRNRLPAVRLWVQVDDAPSPLLEGATRYDDLIAQHGPAPREVRLEDDVYLLYTGGTTGMPKGVMFPVGEFVRRWVNAMAEMLLQPHPDDLTWCVETAKVLASVGALPVVAPACPLMHGTGMWLGVLIPHSVGGHVVLPEGTGFDADALWRTVAAERVTGVVIVGDAFALPLVRELERAEAAGSPYDLSAMQVVFSSGAMLSAAVKEALVARLPESAIVGDLMGSTEGPGGSAVTTREGGPATARFEPSPGTRVFTEDGRDVVPGSGEQGLLAVTGVGCVPLGNFKDDETTARLIRVVDGVRYSVPGDWATVEADGTILLLGRGSGCINTAGEKVYPEEVEEALKLHPAVEDCLVVGLADERFGQRVAAVVSAAPGASITPDEVRAWAKQKLAGYKAPRDVRVVETVPRGPNGKADLRAARALLEGVPA
jgi:fatty-acyl-CoA synthase